MHAAGLVVTEQSYYRWRKEVIAGVYQESGVQAVRI